MKNHINIITAAIFASIMIPAVGYMSTTYNQSVEQLNSTIDNTLIQSISDVKIGENNWLAKTEASLDGLAQYPGLSEMSYEEVRTILKKANANLPWNRSAFITNKDGLQYARSDEEKLVFVGDRAYFNSAKKNGNGMENIISRVTNSPGVMIAKPFYSKDGEFKGVVAYAQELKPISEAIMGDKADKIIKSINSSDKDEVKKDLKEVSRVKNRALLVDKNGNKWHAYYDDKNSVFLAESDYASPLETTKMGLTLVGFLSLILATGCSWVMRMSLKARIQQVAEMSSRGSEANAVAFNVAASEKIKDNTEIGLLASLASQIAIKTQKINAENRKSAVFNSEQRAKLEARVEARRKLASQLTEASSK